MVFLQCVCLQNSPFYKDTNHIDSGPTPLQYDLIVTDYICSDPTSKWGHILRKDYNI